MTADVRKSPAQQHYIPVPLPELAPELRGKTLFEHVVVKLKSNESKGAQNVGSVEVRKGKASGFSFDKAISGIKGELGSASSTRGDGKFDGGQTLMRQ